MQRTLTPSGKRLRNNLVSLRGKRGVSRVARDLGLTRKTIYDLEKGESVPSRQTLEALCAYYKCNVGDIFFVEDFVEDLDGRDRPGSEVPDAKDGANFFASNV